jgi:hypothetical protein
MIKRKKSAFRVRKAIKPHWRLAAKNNVEFFGNPNKKRRERWIVERWATCTSNSGSILPPQTDPPDFLVGDRGVEIVEVLAPGRTRHAEFKTDLDDARRRRARIHDSESLQQVLAEGHKWVENQIEKKNQKYSLSHPADGGKWTLVLYISVSFSDRIQWNKVRQWLSKRPGFFHTIDALLADGLRVEQLLP